MGRRNQVYLFYLLIAVVLVGAFQAATQHAQLQQHTYTASRILRFVKDLGSFVMPNSSSMNYLAIGMFAASRRRLQNERARLEPAGTIWQQSEVRALGSGENNNRSFLALSFITLLVFVIQANPQLPHLFFGNVTNSTTSTTTATTSTSSTTSLNTTSTTTLNTTSTINTTSSTTSLSTTTTLNTTTSTLPTTSTTSSTTTSITSSTTTIFASALPQSFINGTLASMVSSGQLLIVGTPPGAAANLSTAQLSNMTPLNNGQFNRLLANFSPYLGPSTNGSVVLEAVNLTVPYGTLKSNNKNVKVGLTHYAAYSLNNTLTYYIVDVRKQVPKLHVKINGADITQPNQTVTIHVPILPGQKTYNVSLQLSSSTYGNDSIPFVYNIAKTDAKSGKTTSLAVSNQTTNQFSRSISLSSIPVNQSVQVTFDTSGNSNYTSVDPSANIIPTNILFYVPITITNSQSVDTVDNFQQLVTVDSATYKKYEAGNLMNVEFFYPNGIFLDSWLEGPASNTVTATNYWVALSNTIVANSHDIVFMGFADLQTDLMSASGPAGEAPQLTPGSQYGSRDDGYLMFNLYDNFNGVGVAQSGAGNVPTAGMWNTMVVDNGFGIVNNGLTLSLGSNTAGFVHLPSLAASAPNIIEANVISIGRNTVYGIAFDTNTPFGTSANVAVNKGMGFRSGTYVLLGSNTVGCPFAGTCIVSNIKNGYYEAVVLPNTIRNAPIANYLAGNAIGQLVPPIISAFGWNAANQIGLSTTSLTQVLSKSNSLVTYQSKNFRELFLYNGNSVTFQYVFTRGFPPDNVMPSVSFGQTIGVMNFTETGLPQNTPWNVVYNGALQWNAVAFPNSVIFETNTLSSGAYSVNSQSGYVPTPSSGTATPGNTVSIAFAQPASCVPVVSNTAITFPTTNPGSNSPSANVILVN
ncbi:MAG: hypothetical protein KGH78_02520, partial [Candidatus Micrarchaeota archaeon]|nr:hypothetical protein [Candidatus Micrarchaeota archaeon]